MGFTLRLLLGLFLVLAICSSSKSASTWRHVKLLSQEPSTLEPIDKNSAVVNTGSSDEEEEEQKPKTDETNKIVSEISTKEEEVEPLNEHKLDKPLPVTENNDLNKDSLETTRTANLDTTINKYISPEFHDKNNVYKLSTSPDIEKYLNFGNDSQHKQTSSFDSTSNYDIHKKIQTIKNDIEKKLQYIDEHSPKSTLQYEETTDNEPVMHSDIIKYKNNSFTDNNGKKFHKDEQVESGQKLDYASSYNHVLVDEQQHLFSSETVYDNKPKMNETDDDLKNKIFRGKSSATDPEVVHEKLNQTERHTALLSNKIEHDNTNENRRLKWPFQYTQTTPSYTTSSGQKEEIMFVPYTKENPINISKRGSTKFIDTLTTQKSIERKQTKALDESAVENQIYPVQVPAPNNISNEDITDHFTTTISPTIISTNKISPDSQNVSVTTATPNTTTLNESTTEKVVTETEPVTSNIIVQTTKQIFATVPTEKENTTLTSPEKDNGTNSTPSNHLQSEKGEENVTVSSVLDMPTSTYGTFNESTINQLNLTSATDENTTIGNTAATEVLTTEGTATTVDYVSDQTIGTVINNEPTVKNVIVDLPTTFKDVEITQSDTTTRVYTANAETTTLIPDTTTLKTNLSSEDLTTLSVFTEHKVAHKADDFAKTTTSVTNEDRTLNGRELKNLSTISIHSSTEMLSETTTVDFNDNIINQSDILIPTTEHIHKKEPFNNADVQIGKKVNLDVSAFSDHGRGDETTGSSYTGSEEQDEGIGGGKIAAIVISCIGAVCFIILAILLFVMRKRHKRFNYGQRCTPVSLDAYSVDNVSTYNSVRRKGMMRASKRSYGNPAFEESSVSHLLNFPELMKFGANKEGIISEYDDIPQISVETNELPEGCEIKNRYANVIPLPESRVFLSIMDNCPNSDYINANFVTGPKTSKNYYIACQAPMQNTVDDFWRMIWEQQSRVILMLTHLFENGAEKCFDYLPPSEVLDCHRLFGDFQVTLKKREVKEKYVISNLQLKNMVLNTWREVTHLWYLGWPERGVPAEESSLAAFLIEARSYAKTASSESGKIKDSTAQGSNTSNSENSPVVVHCSPGTGRTGTVIACDIAIREFELSRQVDIPKTVYQIRRNRAGAVQTKEQYAFIYRVITWYANKLTGGVLDPV